MKNIICIVISAIVVIGLAFVLFKILRKVSLLENRVIILEKKEELFDLIEQQTRPMQTHAFREEEIFENLFRPPPPTPPSTPPSEQKEGPTIEEMPQAVEEEVLPTIEEEKDQSSSEISEAIPL